MMPAAFKASETSGRMRSSSSLSTRLFKSHEQKEGDRGRSFQVAEPRYNLATKVMRNGVEVIVATDKNVKPLEPEFLRLLSSTVTRPITLAPHTLSNLMSMVLSSEETTDGHFHFMSLLKPTFITKTYYTIYNYKTTAFKNDTTAVSNGKATVTNLIVEPSSKANSYGENIHPTTATSILLNASPTLQTEVYHTAYTYLNTFIDGDQPLIMSSTHTVSNTLIGTPDSLNELEPSEVFPTTNTYYQTVELTKTLTDGTDHHIMSTKDVVTQVVVTDKPEKESSYVPLTMNVTKTYFVTYTYFSTYIDGDKTKVKSDVSVSSDVTIEKFYIKPKKTDSQIKRTENPIKETTFPFNIRATRTYLTTFTYFTTHLREPINKIQETVVNSKVKVVENVVTETIAQQDLDPTYLLQLNNSLQTVSGSIVATATLKKGDEVVITAYKAPPIGQLYQKYEIQPTKINVNAGFKTEVNQIENSFNAKPALRPSFTNKIKASSVKPNKIMNNLPAAESLVSAKENTQVKITQTVTMTPAAISSGIHKLSNTNEKVSPSDEEDLSSSDVEENEEKTEPPAPPNPTKKKEEVQQSANQTVNTLLNGMTVLGPVFNAMAELLNNKINKNEVNVRRNDTFENENEYLIRRPTSNNVNPILNFVNKFTSGQAKPNLREKVTTPRIPVYIPVGSFAEDSDVGESQDSRVVINSPENWHEKWKDIHAKNFEKIRNHENPITILEGGIPISPGQVITTNSDVIIGRPGESGPMPPTFALKNAVPLGIQPPPLPPEILEPHDGDHFVGQQTIHQNVNFDFNKENLNGVPPRGPFPPPHKAQLQSHGHKIIGTNPNDRRKGGFPQKNTVYNKQSGSTYDSGTADLNPPPLPPLPNRSQNKRRPIKLNYEQIQGSGPYKSSQKIHPIPVHLRPNQNSKPSDFNPHLLGLPSSQITQIHPENNHLLNEPTPNLQKVNPGGVVLIPTAQNISPALLRDQPAGHSLLVNVQPSQVTNVVIPHGSSTALIIGGEEHSLKGEVIDDPSPHPEPETVGFVGVNPVLKLENDDIATSVKNEIIAAASGEPRPINQNNGGVFSHRPPSYKGSALNDQNFHPNHNEASSFNRPPFSIQQSNLLISQSTNQGTNIFANPRPQQNGGEQIISLQNRHPPGNKVPQNFNNGLQSSIKESIEGQTYINQKLRNEELIQNLNKHKVYDNNNGGPNHQNIPHPSNPIQGQRNGHPLNPTYGDQIKFTRGQNIIKGGNGIYIDILPAGHSPQSQNVRHPPKQRQPSPQENLANHQSGTVQDVPLIPQLSPHKNPSHILKDILINTNQHDPNQFGSQQSPQFYNNQHLRPNVDYPDILSPPPLPENENSHRPQRPFISKRPLPASDRYPSLSQQSVPTPADFMKPPPQRPGHPHLKTRPDQSQRPVIPIGAGAPIQNYGHLLPVEMVIVPNKDRPGDAAISQGNSPMEVPKPSPSSHFYDLDVSGSNGPFKTEHGEEIQESVSRPLYPGQVFNEIIKLNETLSKQQSNLIRNPQIRPPQSQIAQTQILIENPENKDGQTTLSSVPSTTWNSQFSQTSNIFTNVSNKWSNNNYYQAGNTRPSTVGSAVDEVDFTGINQKPSGFVSSVETDFESLKFINHKGAYSGSGDKNYQSTNSQEASGVRDKNIGDSVKSGSENISSGTSNNYTTSSSEVQGGSSQAGFGVVEKGNSENIPNDKKRVNLQVGGAIREQSTYSTTNDRNQINKTPSEYYLSGADKTLENIPYEPDLRNRSTTDQKTKNNFFLPQKPPSGFVLQSESINSDNNKYPVHYGVPNRPYNSYAGKYPQNFTRIASETVGVIRNPSKTSSDNSNRVTYNTNKITIGYPTITNVPVQYIGSNVPRPFSHPDSVPQGTNKRPSGFSKPTTDETNKVFGSSTNNRAPPPESKKTQNIYAPTFNGKVPSGFKLRNETFINPISNNNYNNQSHGVIDNKKTFSGTKEHNASYSSSSEGSNNWFVSTFSSDDNQFSQNNVKSPNNHPAVLKPSRNSTISDVLLTPPALTNSNSNLEEVLGMSPPPLDRPRRPQRPQRPPRPQRPNSPYQFEVPKTPKPQLTPIAVENDFPPVRSPDFNRKPVKPQDIFPPRLPNNFVHHIPDYLPGTDPYKLRPQGKPATSLPIDVPSTTTSNEAEDLYDEDIEEEDDFEENEEEDAFVAESEINGHSKPIAGDNDVLYSYRPSVQGNRSTSILPFGTSSQPQEKVNTKVSESSRPVNIITDQSEGLVVTPTKDQISPTLSTKDPQTLYSTKLSDSVTPTTSTPPLRNWQNSDVVIGSETIFGTDNFNNFATPSINTINENRKKITTLISTGATTIFNNLYTKVPPKVSESNTHLSNGYEGSFASSEEENDYIAPTSTVPLVHTTTLTVTTTMTTVLHSVGHKPLTKTIVLTKTLISTVFNKITETKTLVKPTTATIIQTHTIATTKTALVVPTALYPTPTKFHSGGTLKPEIFVADPHAKDTLTIQVSSSLNKNQNNEDKRRPSGTRLEPTNKESMIVVVSNQHPNIDIEDNEIDVTAEESEGNDSRVLVGGVFDGSEEKEYKEENSNDECYPGCQAKRNELCQKLEGVMKCVCRPGFARIFPDRPCRPTYTYKMKLALEKLGSEKITHDKSSPLSTSPNMAKLASAAKEGLDRMIMQSELRDVYHGVMVNGFQGKEKKTMVDFYVQLSENTDEDKLMDIFKKTLQSSNYSLGGTELYAAREADGLNAEDFNECLNPQFHDCSEHARCFNLKGTYTCSCKEGYTDLSENSVFPGRVCSDTIGCEYCGYHGACYSKGEGQITCECFQWYSGDRCNINLKVLLIALVTIGAILLAFLLVCGVLTCLNKRSRSSTSSRSHGYLRYRGPTHSIDRRAMIGDTSSESSLDNIPYVNPPVAAVPITAAVGAIPIKKKPVLRQVKAPAPKTLPPPGLEQRDRSVTVMIPRAKYRPMPPLSPHLTMSTFSPDKHLHKTAAQIATEQKLLSYLDGSNREERTLVKQKAQTNSQEKEQQKTYELKATTTNSDASPKVAQKKKESRVYEYEYKISNMMFSEETNSAERRSTKSGDDRFRRYSDSAHMNNDSNKGLQFRKYSAGALVSAGYEVSAKVGMHHLEDEIAEDDHLGLLNTHTMKSNRSQFTTLNRTGDHKTMSEARSYDETTVHPQTRSLKTNYSESNPSSRANNDEGHTMIERDLGSTFIMSGSQLFKPETDRGSDISNFDSL